jgi:putative ABC transport system permease protein
MMSNKNSFPTSYRVPINLDVLLSPRWHKLLNDLAQHRVQLSLAIISMIAGIFAVGLVLGARTLLLTNIDTQYQASHPATASFMLTDFEEGLTDYARKLPQVAEADAVRTINARLFDQSNTASTAPPVACIGLIAIEDFKDQRLNVPLLLEGIYPPPKNTIALKDLLND